MHKQGNCQTTGAYLLWPLRNLFFFLCLVNLCLISAGEELVYDSWLEREAESGGFGSGQAEGGV